MDELSKDQTLGNEPLQIKKPTLQEMLDRQLQ